LQRQTQAVFLLLTRRADIAIVLFSLLFFPGVLLHETSHYLMAHLLGVRTGRFSLLPRPVGQGRLRLGYVETTATDWLRDALIGVAPLLLGGAFVAYAGVVQLGLVAVWEQWARLGPPGSWQAFETIYAQPDFWIWFYLTFAISSTMLPSASDRRAWLPMALFAGLLLAGSLLFGAGPWLVLHAAPTFNRLLQGAAVVVAISDLVHLVLLPPAWALHRLLSRLTGFDIA
jgi:hypothetical protein